MAFAIRHISGCHLNPAVTIGLFTGCRFPAKDIVPYIIAQLAGAIIAAFVISIIANGQPGFNLVESGFAAKGYGKHSPGGYSLSAALVREFIITFMFLFIILGSTGDRAPLDFAPIAIGLGLTLIHLISIPVTNNSVNPAHSTSQALFVGGWAIQQLWLFWVAPIIGAILAGIAYRAVGAGRNRHGRIRKRQNLGF